MSVKLQQTDPPQAKLHDSIPSHTSFLNVRARSGVTLAGGGDRLQRWSLVLSTEIALCMAAFLLTVWILNDGVSQIRLGLATVVLVVFPARAVFLFLLGPFRSSLRHGSVHELLAIGKSMTLSSLVIAIFLVHERSGGRDPLGLLVMDWALCLVFLGVLHFGARLYQSQAASWRRPLKRIAVVGAGDAGATLVKELASDRESRFRPTAIFDDNPKTHGTTICGVPVVGTTDLLPGAAKARAVDEVLICIPSATSSEMSRLFTICCQSGLPVRRASGWTCFNARYPNPAHRRFAETPGSAARSRRSGQLGERPRGADYRCRRQYRLGALPPDRSSSARKTPVAG